MSSRLIIAACAVVACVTALAGFVALKKVASAKQGIVRLEVRDSVMRTLYGSWPLENGGTFSVEFVHSVNNSPVRETFRVTADRQIKMESVRFYSFGAGMASDLADGQVISRDGDALVISGFNRSFRELRYIVGTVSDHVLLVNDKEISLRGLCGKNAAVTFTVSAPGFWENIDAAH